MDEITVSQMEEPPFPLNDVDRQVLRMDDSQYHCHTWEDLRNVIDTNNLSVLKRKPSDLRRYMAWTAEQKKLYGSVTAFILEHRLPKAWGSPPFSPASTTPFQDPSDYRVLVNDWPYGFAPGITHFIVWSRTNIPTIPISGDMTPESKKIVASFVKQHFVESLGHGGGERVQWFKNWVALQSVRTLEHIHVMVKDADAGMLQKWTQG